jgi:hypothetical protein
MCSSRAHCAAWHHPGLDRLLQGYIFRASMAGSALGSPNLHARSSARCVGNDSILRLESTHSPLSSEHDLASCNAQRREGSTASRSGLLLDHDINAYKQIQYLVIHISGSFIAAAAERSCVACDSCLDQVFSLVPSKRRKRAIFISVPVVVNLYALELRSSHAPFDHAPLQDCFRLSETFTCPWKRKA